MFILHQSNRMESLFDHLVELTATPLTEVLRPETILVQSQGMARWLALEFAKGTGISANLDCPFPAAFIWRLLSAGAGLSGPSPYEPETMRWAVMELLAALQDEQGFGQVAAYLTGDGPEIRRYHLAGRVAALLDHYQIHRPEWIEAWAAGLDTPGDKANGWQARLWRALLARHGPVHRVELFRRFRERCSGGTGTGLALDLPERISLFGIPALPPSQLRFFALLAEEIDVHLFLLAPSGHFWADLASRRAMVQAGLRHGTLDPAADLHLEEGCQLLMGLGRVGREFQALLQEIDIQPGLEHFVDPGYGTLLRLIQSDLNAALKQPPLDPTPGAATAAEGEERSIRIHAAHSPMREVEILHDQLLHLLSTRPELEADEILVMVPEIGRYAPLVEAVFSDPAGEGTRLPFTIADRGGSGPLVKGLFDLLDLLESRATVRQVLALLGQDPVRDGLGLDDEDLGRIRTWLAEAGVNWGLSAEDRTRFWVPAEGVGTWRTGLDRLLMGLLAPGDGRTLIHGLLPTDLLEAGQGPCLTKLLNFVEALTALTAMARTPQPLAEWRDLLATALDRFFDPAERYHGERQQFRAALDDLVQVSGLAGFRDPIPLEVVRIALEQRLATGMGNFLCGRITFCQMVPMRSIPFKVICLLGMNDNAFPRQERTPGFDLMAGNRRPGDRNRRDDDRYLFLETLLSAREVLYLSYVGMNSANAPVPPSVVVSELVDHLAIRLGLSPGGVGELLVTRHPLHPFSRRYFNGELFSYSRERQAVATALGAVEPWPGLLGQEIPLAGEPSAAIELDDLVRFFVHPVRALLRSRLGLYLDEREELTAERERFSLTALDSYQLMAELTEQALQEVALAEDLCSIAQLKGDVALGMAGHCQFQACHREAGELARRLRLLRGQEPLPARDFTLRLDGATVCGVLDGLWPSGHYLYRPGKIDSMKLGDLIPAWIRHLCLSAVVAEEGWPTTFLYRDGAWRYPFVPEARATLSSLIDLYRYGQGRPLPLLPSSSLAYARKRWTGKGAEAEQALVSARACWEDGGFFGGAERDDPYLALAYGDRDPFTVAGPYDFHAVATLVLAPALQWGERL